MLERLEGTVMGNRRRLMSCPPGYFLVAVFIAIAIHSIWPVSLISNGILRYLISGVLVAVGVTLLVWSIYLFRKAVTPVDPHQTPTALVVSGPYRFSRNPIYLGDALITAGLGVAYGTVWIWPSLALALVLLDRQVIQVEECRLMESFPVSYRRYRQRVRRWI